MKKLVIAVLAIGAMAACTKSNIQYEQPEEISFQPVAKKATKAVYGAIDETTYPTDEKFNVWSWWTSVEAETSIENIPGEFDEDNTPPDEPILYINEGTFENRESNNWGGETPYYWPTTGSLVFAGYSPSDASDSGSDASNSCDFNYDFKNQKFTVTNYIQSNEIDKTVDLMWFDADQSYKQTDAVRVTFKHALSWLEFRFNLAGDVPRYWKIHKVYLKGIETKASFTSKDATSKPSWTTDPSFTAQLIVYENEEGLKLDHESPDYDNLSDEAKKGVVVIPQSCKPAVDSNLADAELVIEYGLLTPATADKTEAEKVYIDQSVTLPLNYSCNTTEHNPGHDEYMWEPGCHYIYTITFGANEILISPLVTDWTDEDEDINVE